MLYYEPRTMDRNYRLHPACVAMLYLLVPACLGLGQSELKLSQNQWYHPPSAETVSKLNITWMNLFEPYKRLVSDSANKVKLSAAFQPIPKDSGGIYQSNSMWSSKHARGSISKVPGRINQSNSGRGSIIDKKSSADRTHGTDKAETMNGIRTTDRIAIQNHILNNSHEKFTNKRLKTLYVNKVLQPKWNSTNEHVFTVAKFRSSEEKNTNVGQLISNSETVNEKDRPNLRQERSVVTIGASGQLIGNPQSALVTTGEQSSCHRTGQISVESSYSCHGENVTQVPLDLPTNISKL
ncbi:hypothetical protein ElyMa_004315000 [Elysia marginata]|uniref:Uncharacterized protein n=1 Tax=Elysia marginata TaxID=1093978 RepID=A0AAV4GYU0_9GAST|nr:hypothetical protein ElyMa_004315000 [Elysia marginata]